MGAAVEQLPCFKDLISVLIECFLVIGLGYLSASLKVVSPQAKDINSYLTNLALPMIIFLNIAQMELNKINMSFLICILLAKIIVFITVTILTLATSYPRNFGYAGILSILTTQSNDFALGYPLIKSLYNDPQKKMLSYLSLMAPIQLLILNPVGIIMMEYNKTQQLKKKPPKPPIYNQTSCNCFLPPPDRACLIESTEVKMGGNYSRSIVEGCSESIRQIDQISRSSSKQESSYKNRKINRKPLATINTISNDNCSAHSEESSADASSATISKRKILDASRSFADRHQESSLSRCCSVETIDKNFNKSLSKERLADDSTGKPVVCSCGYVPTTKSRAKLTFLIALATNPIIVASLAALIVNQNYGSTLPKFVSKVASTIAASFAAPAMFVVGVSLYGKFQLLLKNPTDLLLSSVLVLTKELILSNLFRTITLFILPHYMKGDELSRLIDFSFLYGLLPNAPNASVLANQYGLLTNVVSTCMLLSTLISAPLMFLAALIINKPSILQDTLGQRSLSSLTKFLCSIVLSLALVLFYSILRAARKRRFDPESPPVPTVEEERVEEIRPNTTDADSSKNMERVFLILLVMCQALVGIGGVTRFFMQEPEISLPTSMGNFAIKASIQNYSTSTNQAYISNQPPNLEESSKSNSISNHLFENSVDHNPEVQILEQTISNYSQVWLNRLQYSLSSYGIVMARIIVIGFALTLVVAERKGPEIGRVFAGYLWKLHHLIALILALGLFLTSNDNIQTKITDITLPDTISSLYLRLSINMLFISTVLPVLIWMFRRSNKEKLKLLEDISYIKRNFITSKNPTPSESSSAVTMNTCLESSSPNNNSFNQVYEINNNQVHVDDSLLVTLESSCSEQKFTERPTPYSESKTYPITDSATSRNPPTSYEAYDNDGQNFGNRLIGDLGNSLNRHCILLVIMLFNSCYNLSTVAQRLIHQETFGTFRQIEMTNISLELSPGIWTFLLYRKVTRLFN